MPAAGSGKIPESHPVWWLWCSEDSGYLEGWQTWGGEDWGDRSRSSTMLTSSTKQCTCIVFRLFFTHGSCFSWFLFIRVKICNAWSPLAIICLACMQLAIVCCGSHQCPSKCVQELVLRETYKCFWPGNPNDLPVKKTCWFFFILQGDRFGAYDKIGNRKLLWHGTNVAVVAAILKSGLRIMPHSGGRVGKGIYFASENSKSAGYGN